MVLGFNEYISELLLEAKTPEEVVRILSARYKDIPVDTIKQLVDIDPTKKKSYSSWVLRVESNPNKIESYINSGKLSKIFKYFQENANSGADLMSVNSLKDAEKYLPDFIDIFSHDDNEEANDYDIEFRSDEWIIAVPHTLEASKKLGVNTRWCTADAYGNGSYYFPQYNNQGPLWINYDLRKSETLGGVTYPFKRYQFCFEANAFLDAHDDAFDWDDMDMPEDVQEFYKKKGYSLDYLMESDEERYERYQDQRYEDGIRVFDDLWLLRSFNREYVFDENENYELYNTEYDDVDSNYGDYYGPDALVFINREENIAVLKELRSDTYTICLDTEGGFEVPTGVSNYLLLGSDASHGIVWVTFDGNLEGFIENTKCECVCNNSIDDGATLFLNEPVSVGTGDIYIEVINDEGYHSLFAFSNGELTEIIKMDIPENEKMFEISEDGRIHGKFKKAYTLATDEQKNESQDYTPSSYLCDRKYITGEKWENGSPVLNIFAKEGHELIKLFNEDFAELKSDKSNSGIVIVKTLRGKFQALSLLKGQPISSEFDAINTGGNFDDVLIVGANKGSDGGYTDGRYVITDKGEVKVKEVSNTTVDKKCIVKIVNVNGELISRVLDRKTGQFYPNWMCKILILNVMNTPNALLAQTNDGEKIIYNWPEDKIITRHIEDIERLSYGIYTIKFDDGKTNIMSRTSLQLMIPENVDTIHYPNAISRQGYTVVECQDAFYFINFDFSDGSGKIIGEVKKTQGVETWVAEADGKPFVGVAMEVNGKTVQFICRGDYNINHTITTYILNGMQEFAPLDSAPPEIKSLAARIFSQPTQAIQSLNERIDRLRKL